MLEAYAIGGVVLERVEGMRNLSILLDQRLTFGDHVEHTVRKANRALGLLMRTFGTGRRGRSLDMLKPVTFCTRASPTSVPFFLFSSTYCSVVWSGAARTHVQRIERVQEKFLSKFRARVKQFESGR